MHNDYFRTKFPEVTDFNSVISEVSTYEIPNISIQGVRYIPEGFYYWVGGKTPKSNGYNTSINYCVRISPEWVSEISQFVTTEFVGLWPSSRYLIRDNKIDIEGRDRSGIGSPILFRWDVSTIPDYLLPRY